MSQLSRVLAAALVWIGAAQLAAAEESPAAQAQAFEEEMAELGRLDPMHPDVLSRRFDYAGAMAQFALDDCKWLRKAQAQLDQVKASPVASILLPTAEARTLDVEYRIHSARAKCARDERARQKERRAALEKAGSAAAAFENAHAYLSTAVMHFNAAAAHRELGEHELAFQVLERAIETGKRYGLRGDVEENYGILQSWRGQENPAAVAQFMKAMPLQKASFRFAWKPSTARQRLVYESRELVQGKVVQHRSVIDGKARAERKGRNWIVSGEYTPGETTLSAGDGRMPDEVTRKLTEYLTRALANLPAMTVTRAGEMKELQDIQGYSERLTRESKQFIDALFVEGDPRRGQMQAAFDANFGPQLQPAILESHARERFGLETAMWIGTSFDHGDTYEMPLVLSMAGAEHGAIEHQLEFAVTQWLPCTESAKEPRCVEIVLTARPQENAVAALVDNLGKQQPDRAPWQYWALTRFRLVTDPSTLLSYATDERRYSYIGYAAGGKREREIKFERTTSTSVYE
jgi:hypothetical protein